MATLYQGQTFGTVEQVTNTKLHNLVANASISGITLSDMSYQIGSYATNASLVDITSVRSLKLYYSTYGSLATFIGAHVGLPFTIFAQQASFPALVDTGSFKLASNWSPAKQYDNITLVWDGSVFIEVGRVTT